jgi:hypothetical protein
MVVSNQDMAIVQDSSIHKEFVGSDHCPIQLKLDFNRLVLSQNPAPDNLAKDTIKIGEAELKEILEDKSTCLSSENLTPDKKTDE